MVSSCGTGSDPLGCQSGSANCISCSFIVISLTKAHTISLYSLLHIYEKTRARVTPIWPASHHLPRARSFLRSFAACTFIAQSDLTFPIEHISFMYYTLYTSFRLIHRMIS